LGTELVGGSFVIILAATNPLTSPKIKLKVICVTWPIRALGSDLVDLILYKLRVTISTNIVA
jgi:hypothetical protein